MKIIFDYNRTIFNPETGALYPGVINILKNLSHKHELFLIGRHKSGRATIFNGLNIKDYFREIIFTDLKTPALFQKITEPANQTIIVGDRLQEEITIGNRLQAITVWINRQGITAGTDTIIPQYTITALSQLSDIICKHDN